MWAPKKCMNLGAPCESTIILDVNIYAKTIRHNAFQQKHILTCNPSEQLLVDVKPLVFFGRLLGQICSEDYGSCYWLYDWPLVCVKNSQCWQQMSTWQPIPLSGVSHKTGAVWLMASRGWGRSRWHHMCNNQSHVITRLHRLVYPSKLCSDVQHLDLITKYSRWQNYCRQEPGQEM